METRIVKLNNSNYESWAFCVKALLRRESLWKYVDPGTAPNPVTNAWAEGDEKTLTTIQLLVEESQIHLIRSTNTAKATWNVLKSHHNKLTLGQKVSTLKQITNLNYKVGDDMEAYFAAIEKLYIRLENAGFEMQECLKVALVLRGLPDSFTPLIMALEARNEEDLTMAMVKAKLIDEAEKRQNCYGDANEQVLKVGARSKVLSCFHCGKIGHKKRECREFLAEKKYEKEKSYKKKPKEKAKKVRENDLNGSFTFMVTSVGRDTKSWPWVIDSGATSHLTNDKSVFVRLDSSVRPVMSTADGKVLRTEGIGDCEILCLDDSGKNVKITLTDVIYAPELEGSLVSIGKLSEKGVQTKFVGDTCKLLFKGRVIATAMKAAGLYRLNLVRAKSLMVGESKHNEECMHTWHRKLGHRDPEAIAEIERKGFATGINIAKCGIRMTCESCVKGKMSRPQFPSSAEKKSKEILDIVHSDLCGPMTETPGGCKFYMTMIDDHSRYTVIYFLKAKSEVEEKIRQYVRFTQNQFGRKPKIIRSDRGGEYTGNNLRKFYTDEGIRPEYTAGYAPQQNGVAERKNRSINEMGLCMLLDAGLPRRFWAEAMNTAVYIQNRLPSRVIESTPYEIWFNRKPDLSKMKIFGSSAYVWVPPQKRKKLDDKAAKMTFVGYCSESKAYRFLDTRTGKILISRDVKFLDEIDKPKAEAPFYPIQKEKMHDEVSIRLSDSRPAKNDYNESEADESNDDFFGWESQDDTYIGEKESVNHEIMRQAEQQIREEFSEEYKDEENVDPEEHICENQSINVPVTRRFDRANRGVPPVRYGCIRTAIGSGNEPRSYAEAVSSVDSTEWKAAMEEEMASHQENGTWELTQLPPNRRAVGCKWVFKRKEDETGKVARFKARLVAQGFLQRFGSDYDEVFAPVMKQTTLRTVLTIASRTKMHVKHIDIKTAYLYGELQEELYMKQPPGYGTDDPTTVCRLKKSLYGLKQAARVWNQRIDATLKSIGFQRSNADQCLYTCRSVYILIYVDDIIIACQTGKEYTFIVKSLQRSFKVVELGDIKFFLGIHVRKENDHYVLSQKSYISKVLEKFHMQNCKPSNVPMSSGFQQQKEESSEKLETNQEYQSVIGALLYLAVNTRPDISIATSILGRRVSKATKADWTECKKVLRYLQGTKDYELHLGRGKQQKLEAFVDADWAGAVADRKSNTGFMFKLDGGLVSWICRKQTSVTLSSCEAEYVALAECLQELQWLRKLFADLGISLLLPIIVYEDNQSCIALTVADRSSRRSKHIDTKYCFVKDLVKDGVVSIQYCPTDQMQADILTKPLGPIKLKVLRELIGIKSSEVEEECWS